MSNPILSAFGRNSQQPTQQPQSNTLMGMLNMVRSSSNPNQAMQQMLSGNPQYQNVMDYINQNGGDARTAFYNMAAQKGIDPESILRQLR
jgi:hypothetical protein